MLPLALHSAIHLVTNEIYFFIDPFDLSSLLSVVAAQEHELIVTLSVHRSGPYSNIHEERANKAGQKEDLSCVLLPYVNC